MSILVAQLHNLTGGTKKTRALYEQRVKYGLFSEDNIQKH